MDDGGKRRLGRYVLHGRIGSGGVATLSLGRLAGEKGFSRIVAVKQLHPHLVENRLLTTALLDEARLVSLIRHPNVVQILDVISTSEDVALVMELVIGDSLSGLVAKARERQKPIAPEIGVAIIRDVLEGLHAAHEASSAAGIPLGLVHRDVSPHNVLVGVDGVARVTDFGIAKALGRDQATTEQGIVKGKLRYMAPEQFAGQPVDRRADVWAAAVVLWETLTGTLLFEDQTAALLFQVSASEVTLPTPAWPVPAELETIVRRGLMRAPEARFATAREMTVALESACTPAPARRVGQCVRTLARESVSARQEQIRALETEGSMDITVTQEAFVGSPTAPLPSVPPSRSRSLARRLAVGILVGGTGVAALLIGQRVRDLRARTRTEINVTSATPVSASVAMATPSATPSALPDRGEISAVPPSPSASIDRTSKPRATTARPTRSPHTAPSPPTTPAASTAADPGEMGSRK